MRLKVIYPLNLKPGDLLAGVFDPSAPRRPVQEMAHAMVVDKVDVMKDQSGKSWVTPSYGPGLTGTTHRASDVMFLIIEN
jgi:hypothetical protein